MNRDKDELPTECTWCASERVSVRSRKRSLCATCLRIFAQQRRLSRLIDDSEADLLHASPAHPSSDHSNVQYRLQYYRELEGVRRAIGVRQHQLLEEPDGISVEYLFDEVAVLARCPQKTFHGFANTLTHEFNPKQRALLIGSLLEIVRLGGRRAQARLARTKAAQQIFGPKIVSL